PHPNLRIAPPAAYDATFNHFCHVGMPMRIAFLIALGAALVALDALRQAQAYPWCSTRFAVSCGYETYEQCMAAISGDGGFCVRNPMEPEVAQPAPVMVEQPAPAKRAEKKPKPQKKPVATVAPNAAPQ